MASIIRIKRSSVSGNPSTLGAGELAYSALTDNGSNGGDRLYIGIGTETAGNAANHFVIGGKYFTDMLDQTPGTLTASSAIVVDASSKIDNLKVDNLDLNGNTISSTDSNGNILLTPNGTGKVVITNPYIGDTSTTLLEYIYDAVGGTITAGTGITSTVSDAGNTTTLSITNTGVTAGSYGGTTAIPVLTINAQGQITAASTASITTSLSIAGDTGTDTIALASDTLTFVGGTGITSSVNSAANSVTFDIDSTVVTLTGTQTLTNKTLTTPAIGSGGFTLAGSSSGTTTVVASASASGTITIPAATDTLVGKATTDTFTNKTFDTAGTGNSFSINGNAVTAVTGTGNTVVLSTLPTFGGTGVKFSGSTSGTTTLLATAIAGTTTLTLPAASDTLVGKATTDTLTNKTINLSSNTLVATSAQIAAAVTDETGSGSLVFANSPTLVTPVLGAATATSITGASGNLEITAASGNNSINLAPTGTGTVDVASKRITNVAEPTQATDAATKNYVDAVKTGLDPKDSVRVATTAALTATYSNGSSGVGATLTNSGTQAAITIDSIVLSVGDRVLVKNQGTASQNGIYTVTTVGTVSTNWVLTRATDADTAAELTGGAFTFVEEGTTNGDNGFVCTTDGTVTIGTTGIVWVQFSGAGQVIAGAGLTKTGNQIDVVGTADRITANADSIDIASTYVGQASITTLGTITTGTWHGDVLGSTYGGTGVNNGSYTITLGGSVVTAGSFTTSGAYGITLTATGSTSITLPTTGTLATLAGTETFTNKTLTSPTINSATLSGTFSGNHTVSGIATFSNTTDSSSTSTGAIVVSGGVGIAKTLYVGANLTGAGASTSTLDGFNIDGGTY